MHFVLLECVFPKVTQAYWSNKLTLPVKMFMAMKNVNASNYIKSVFWQTLFQLQIRFVACQLEDNFQDLLTT